MMSRAAEVMMSRAAPVVHARRALLDMRFGLALGGRMAYAVLVLALGARMAYAGPEQGSGAPAKPSPAPAKPSPAPAKPSPAPAKPSPAPAKPSPAPANPDVTAEPSSPATADEAEFARAKKLYNAGQFAAAAEGFHKAYDL